jgi:hypothetical protein
VNEDKVSHARREGSGTFQEQKKCSISNKNINELESNSKIKKIGSGSQVG